VRRWVLDGPDVHFALRPAAGMPLGAAHRFCVRLIERLRRCCLRPWDGPIATASHPTGHTCTAPSGATASACVDSTCVFQCPWPFTTVCNGACVATSVDSANCGTCGHACAAGEICEDPGGLHQPECARPGDRPERACGAHERRRPRVLDRHCAIHAQCDREDRRRDQRPRDQPVRDRHVPRARGGRHLYLLERAWDAPDAQGRNRVDRNGEYERSAEPCPRRWKPVLRQHRFE
jgi:hypothetical protein